MVEQEAVNFEVASSSLAGGAIFFVRKNFKKRQTRTFASLRCESGPGSHFFAKRYLFLGFLDFKSDKVNEIGQDCKNNGKDKRLKNILVSGIDKCGMSENIIVDDIEDWPKNYTCNEYSQKLNKV